MLFKVEKKDFTQPSDTEPSSGFQHTDGAGMPVDLILRKDLKQLVKTLTPGHDIHYYTKGAWSMHEMLEYILQVTGPAHIWITTWSVTEEPLRNICRLIDAGQILSLTALFDHKIDQRKPASLQLALGLNARIQLVKCHAKMLVIKNDQWAVSVTGSANLTKNSRLEAGVISCSPEVANFHKTWIEYEFRPTPTH